MKNTLNNKNQNDKIVETMSLADFILGLHMKYIFGFFAFLWVITMAVLISYVELTK